MHPSYFFGDCMCHIYHRLWPNSLVNVLDFMERQLIGELWQKCSFFTFEMTYGLRHFLKNVFLPCMMSNAFSVRLLHLVNSLMELSIKHDLTLHISLSFNIAGRTKRLCINLFMESDRCYKYICCELVSSGVWFLLMFHLIKLLLYWQIGGTSCFIWKNPTFFNFTSVCSCIVHFCEVEVFYDETKMPV